MVGQGVLRECLLDETVQSVLSVGRSITGQNHQKLSELKIDDFMNLTVIEEVLTGLTHVFSVLASRQKTNSTLTSLTTLSGVSIS
jgi:hypothetical protein